MFDFPSSPTVGQLYPVSPSAGQPQYTWDGEKWTSGTSLGAIFISDTPPAAGVGSLWWESDTGNLYVRYNDGDSLQWVMCSQAGTPSGVVRYDAAQTLTTAQKSQARANIDVSKKNYFINGAMMVSQENAASPGTTNSYFPVDQFFSAYSNSGTQTFQQVAVATPAGSPNRIRITATAADASVAAGDFCQVQQYIEGLRVVDLRIGSAAAKTVTLQFGVKAPAGTYCVALRNGAGTRSYVAEYVIAAGEANTDVVKSVTVALDQTGTWLTDTSLGLQIAFVLMCGTTLQTSANTWVGTNSVGTSNQFNFMGTNGNVFEVFDVGLYEGTVAPPFQVPDYASELLLCKRYFYNGVPPCRGVASTTSSPARMGCLHPVTMRVAPVVAMISAVSVFDGTTAVGLSGLGANESTTTTLEFESNTASATLTIGRAVVLYQGGGNITVNARM